MGACPGPTSAFVGVAVTRSEIALMESMTSPDRLLRRAARMAGVGLVLLTVGAATACGTTSNAEDDVAAPSSSGATVPAGSLNSKFAQVGDGFDQPVDAVATHPKNEGNENYVMVGGRFTRYADKPMNSVAKINSDGTLSSSWNPTGSGLNGRVRAIAVQPDRKILVGGEFTKYDSTNIGYIARLDAEGKLDTSFRPPTLTFTGTASPAVWGITIAPDGKILIGGLFKGTAPAPSYVMRLNADGSADTTFKGPGTNGYVKSTAVQADGKILIGGSFTSIGGTPRVNLARLNDDGALDTSFKPTSTGLAAKGYVDQVIAGPDSKVLIGGWFTEYDGQPAPRVARLNGDGSIDTSFYPRANGLNAEVKSMVLQSDGKLLVGGNFTNFADRPAQGVARLGSDGAIDTSFVQTGTGLNSSVNQLAVTSDGNVAVGGAFTAYNTTTIRYAAELLGAPGPAPTPTPTPTPQVPGAPQSVTAVFNKNDKTIRVDWVEGTPGSSPIVSYTATATDKDTKTKTKYTCTSVAGRPKCQTPAVKSGGPQYEVVVTATNAVGTGPASSPPAEVGTK